METICPIDKCTGCMACTNVCSKGAIRPVADDEGFMRPAIDQTLCVDCGLCARVCPANTPPTLHDPIEAFSGWNSDENVRLKSSSGGAFSALASAVIERGGAVYGARLDHGMNVVHACARTADELAALRGSKYAQSQIGKTYREVIHKLSDGPVLFSGTPCQVAGLYNVLKTCSQRLRDNLLTVEVVCHGIPSPLMFDEWKKWFAEKHRLSRFDHINFRDKKRSWIFYNMDIAGVRENGKAFRYDGSYFKDRWIRGFLSDYFLRPSCYECPFAQPARCADFTIADWWDYKLAPGDSPDVEKKGVSLILCNTERAHAFLADEASTKLTLRKQTVADALRTSSPFTKPTPAPANRAEFWETYRNEGFEAAAKAFMRPKKPNFNEWLISRMAPTRTRSLIQKIYYKVRDLSRILRSKDRFHQLARRIERKRTWLTECRFNRIYSARVEKAIEDSRGRKTAYLFCAPIHSNLGDQAQTMCIMRLLRKHYPEHEIVWIPMHLSSDRTIPSVKEALGPDDLIFVHSGYLMTELYVYLPMIYEIATQLTANPVTILPQTVNILTDQWREKLTAAFNSHPNLTLMCRDEISFEKAKGMFTCRLQLNPDVVTSLIGLDEFDFGNKRDGVLFVIRDDKEKFYSDADIDRLKQRIRHLGVKTAKVDTTIKVGPFAWPRRREKIIKDYLKIFSKYRLVITDRYHGTIFSQIVSTPTIVISSSDHKLSSGVKWFPKEEFGDRFYYASDLDETYRLASEILAREEMPPSRSEYFRKNYWDKLVQLIAGKA